MKDGRSDVVGKIPVEADAAAGCYGGEVRFENIAGDDGEIGKVFRKAAQASDQGRIQFDGVDRPARGEEMPGDFAMTGANLDPAVLVVSGEWRRGMRRDADGAGNLFAPVEVGEKMLAKVLPSHGWECSKSARRVLGEGPTPSAINRYTSSMIIRQQISRLLLIWNLGDPYP